MRKTLKIILEIIISLLILWIIIFIIDYNRCNNLKTPIFVIEGKTVDGGGSGTYYGIGYKVKIEKNISAEYGVQLESVEMYFWDKVIAGAISQIDADSLDENTESNIAIIRDGNIEDESIIENFINKVNNNTDKKEIVLNIREYNSDKEYIEKELKFIPGTITNSESIDENTTVTDIIPDTSEEAKKLFGYYSLTTNNGENVNETFSAYYWKLKRNIEENIVKFRFESVGLIQVTEFPVICSYSLDSSNYTNNFKLNYHQRKDMGIKTIIDKNTSNEYDYNVYTFGGDVTITIDIDMVYTLDDALKQRVITTDDIIKQAKIDEQYGICESGAYNDGGSTEYRYKGYTILKFNTLDGKKDIVFGFSGQIMNQFNRISNN